MKTCNRSAHNLYNYRYVEIHRNVESFKMSLKNMWPLSTQALNNYIDL